MITIKLYLSIACTALLVSSTAMAIDLPPEVSNYLQSQHIMDEGQSPLPYRNSSQNGTGDIFIRYVTNNWSAILDNLPTIALEPRQQYMIVRALEYLPGRSYLEALDKLCDQAEKGNVSNAVLEFAADENVPKNGFLSNNFQDQQVVSVVQRLQSVLAKNSKVQDRLTSILSGKQKVIDMDAADIGNLPLPVTLPAR